MMTEKKNELERRVAVLTQQRDNLSTALDEATDRIMLLERQMREQQLQVSILFELFLILFIFIY